MSLESAIAHEVADVAERARRRQELTPSGEPFATLVVLLFTIPFLVAVILMLGS
jgi:hypothetical protein